MSESDRDIIDTIQEDWRREIPTLDGTGLGVSGRIIVLAARIQREVDHLLEEYGLAQWAFDVLATLRRTGEPFRMSPTELARSTMLSNAAMVNRLDRLEARKLLERLPNPSDRRGVIVQLTPAGKELVEKVLPPRLAEAVRVSDILAPDEQREMERMLRKLCVSIVKTDT